MLGYVFVGQPTVIFRVSSHVAQRKCLGYVLCQTIERDRETKQVNAWKCAPPTTDHDHANAIFYLKL